MQLPHRSLLHLPQTLTVGFLATGLAGLSLGPVPHGKVLWFALRTGRLSRFFHSHPHRDVLDIISCAPPELLTPFNISGPNRLRSRRPWFGRSSRANKLPLLAFREVPRGPHVEPRWLAYGELLFAAQGETWYLSHCGTSHSNLSCETQGEIKTGKGGFI